jgi:hypothetical protein
MQWKKGGKGRKVKGIQPTAGMIPSMSAKEYEGLKADIAEHGQHEPIWTYKGDIIDGRHHRRTPSLPGVLRGASRAAVPRMGRRR